MNVNNFNYLSMLVLRTYVLFYGDLPSYNNCNKNNIDYIELNKIVFMMRILNKYNIFGDSFDIRSYESITSLYLDLMWNKWKELINENGSDIYAYLEKIELLDDYNENVICFVSYLLREQIEKKISRDIKYIYDMDGEEISILDTRRYIDNYFWKISSIFYLRDSFNLKRMWEISTGSEPIFSGSYMRDEILNECEYGYEELRFRYSMSDVVEIDKFFEEELNLLVGKNRKISKEKYLQFLQCFEKAFKEEPYRLSSDFRGIVFSVKELVNGIDKQKGYNRFVKKKVVSADNIDDMLF